jgi:urea transport system substrate-binding protein
MVGTGYVRRRCDRFAGAQMSAPNWLRLSLAFMFLAGLAGCARQDSPPLRVGVVHALTGTMAANEAPLVDAVQMAVAELNVGGGVLGRKVEVIVADSRSHPLQAAKEADRLIKQEKIDVLFACWTSSCRKAVKPVVELNHHLMFYPVQYEGLEESPNILYTGATANQQIIPGTHWALQNLGKRVFLAGSDYIFPRLANRIIHDIVQVNGAQVVGEAYRPLGSSDFAALVEAVRIAKPDVILNTVNGDSNIAFFTALQRAGLNHLPVLSFSVDASSLPALSALGHAPHYAAWGYFQELPGEANQRFVRAWQARLKTSAPTSDAIEATYNGVKLWAQAVTAAGSANLEVVNQAVTRQSIAAPSGVMAVDARTRHVWKSIRIGKARPQGGFEIVFDLGTTLRPEPFPSYRPREAWYELASTLAAQGQARLP